jgi:homogentisate 1,2-dioxygenase
MNAHGPDTQSTSKAMEADLVPQKIEATMAFMFESCFPIQPTAWAMQTALLQKDYDDCWTNFPKARLP